MATTTLENQEPKTDAEHSPAEGDDNPFNPSTKALPKPKLWKHTDPYRFAPKADGDSWEECMRKVDEYNDELCKEWKEDIDTHLVFGGLFSAAVTAFIIESYQWLQPNPADDTVLLLRQISQQIGNSTFIPQPSDQSFSADSSSIRINIFWFLSLIITLSSVLLGILCKQWIQEHRRVTYTSSPKEALALSQLRDESLRKWGIPQLLCSLPVMLQMSLLLFFAGILDLLWTLDHVVAIVVSVAVFVVALFVTATTVLPAYSLLVFSIQKNFKEHTQPCPYKSPQAWSMYKFALLIIRKCFKVKIKHYHDWSRSDLDILRSSSESTNLRVNLSLQWAARAFSNTVHSAIHIFQCIQTLPPPGPVVFFEENQLVPTLDALNFWYFTNLHCGWSTTIEAFIAELYLRRVETLPPHGDELANIPSPFHFIEKARFFDPRSSAEKGGDNYYPVLIEASHQTIRLITNYFDEDKVAFDDLAPLFHICRQLWTHPNQQIRDQSAPLLQHCLAWLSAEPVDKGTASSRVEHCAYTLLLILQGAHNSSTIIPFVQTHPVDLLRLFGSVDTCVAAHNIDADAILSQRNLDMTWKEGKIILDRLIGLPFDRLAVASSPAS